MKIFTTNEEYFKNIIKIKRNTLHLISKFYISNRIKLRIL